MSRNCYGLLLIVLLMFALPAAAKQQIQKYPDILQVEVKSSGANRFAFAVTLSSPYDTPQRYADGFRVSNRDGVVYGVRTLWHDHQYEQPFTRSLGGVEIPPDIRVVVIEGRDQEYGFGGKTFEVALPGR